uniref:Double C2 domain alpha n=1 Tax=Eptatretus burgeri TaxID=7764 RepID=A0A8C4N0M3_EPTBU
MTECIGHRQTYRKLHILVLYDRFVSTFYEKNAASSTSFLEVFFLKHGFVHDLQALNVPDAAGHVDPYVKLHLLPGASRATKLRTRTVHGTNAPCWNESLTYLGITDVDMETRTLRLSVCDEDKLGPNVCIGETRVPLRRLRPQQSRTFSVCLEHPLPLERRTAWPEERGRILISLCFVPACSTVSTRAPFSTNQSLATRSTLSAHSGLHVCIVRCAHLAAMDPNGYSDPYVKLLLGPGLGRLGKRKTVVKKRTLNPEFVQEFIFEFQAAELKQRWLQVMVWDYDVARFDDFIGGVVLGMGTQGEARNHWLDCLRQPGMGVERWHPLTSSPLALTSSPITLHSSRLTVN